MHTKFNTLLHGDLSEVSDILSGDRPEPLDHQDVSAILTNICNKMDELGRRIAQLEKQADQ